MKEPESIRFKLNIIHTGNPDVDERKPCNFRPLTYKLLCAWIDEQDIDAKVKEELKKKAGKYPENALPHFQKRYQSHLVAALKKVRLDRKKEEIADEPIEEL